MLSALGWKIPPSKIPPEEIRAFWDGRQRKAFVWNHESGLVDEVDLPRGDYVFSPKDQALFIQITTEDRDIWTIDLDPESIK